MADDDPAQPPIIGDAVLVQFKGRRRQLEGVVTEVSSDGARANVLFLMHAKHELAGSSAWVGAESVRSMATAEPELRSLRVGSSVKVRDDVDALRWVGPARVLDVRLGTSSKLLFLVDSDGTNREWRSMDDVAPILPQQQPRPPAPAAAPTPPPQQQPRSPATHLDERGAFTAPALEGFATGGERGAAAGPGGAGGSEDDDEDVFASVLEFSFSPAAVTCGADDGVVTAAAQGVAAAGGAAAAHARSGGGCGGDGAEAGPEDGAAGRVPIGGMEGGQDAELVADEDAEGAEGEEEGEEDEDNDDDEEGLQLNDAVIVRWGRGARAQELDGLIIDEDARASAANGGARRLLIEFLKDQSKAWVGASSVRPMPHVEGASLPAALRVGSAVEAQDPFDRRASEPGGAAWHAACVVEVRRGVGVSAARGPPASAEEGGRGVAGCWLWVQFAASGLFQWVSPRHVSAPPARGEARVSFGAGCAEAEEDKPSAAKRPARARAAPAPRRVHGATPAAVAEAGAAESGSAGEGDGECAAKRRRARMAGSAAGGRAGDGSAPASAAGRKRQRRAEAESRDKREEDDDDEEEAEEEEEEEEEACARLEGAEGAEGADTELGLQLNEAVVATFAAPLAPAARNGRARGSGSPSTRPAEAEPRPLSSVATAQPQQRRAQLDAVLVDARARGSRLLVEGLSPPHRRVWLPAAQVRLMPAAPDRAVPAALRAGCVVRAIDPFAATEAQPPKGGSGRKSRPAVAGAEAEPPSSAPAEPEWHGAMVEEVKQGAQMGGHAGLWFWVRYSRTGKHQWLAAEQLVAADGAAAEPPATGRLLRLVASLRKQLSAAQGTSDMA